MSYTIRAVRAGSHTSSSVSGIVNPKACCTINPPVLVSRDGTASGGVKTTYSASSHGRQRTIVRFPRIDIAAKQRFDREWHLNRNEEPFEQSRLGQWKIICVTFTFLD